jgi:flavin-binding protein dodecin
MSVVKIIRIVGNSPVSWAKAAAAGVREAARTVRDIQGVEATDFTAKVDASGRITQYRCTLNIAFLVGPASERPRALPRKTSRRR